MKPFWIEPYGGLANRLMALLSAIRISSKFSIDMKVVWTPDINCSCKFCDLFDDITCVVPDPTSIPSNGFVEIGGQVAFFPAEFWFNSSNVAIKSNYFFFLKEDRAASREEILFEFQKAWRSL